MAFLELSAPSGGLRRASLMPRRAREAPGGTPDQPGAPVAPRAEPRASATLHAHTSRHASGHEPMVAGILCKCVSHARRKVA